ncbi:MAG: FG-GAP-like repeat-containing protein [Terracidiphilus sp.]
MSASRKEAILAARINLLTVSQRYPKFTLAQRAAVLRELQSERHPRWRDLSLPEMARRLASIMMATPSTSQAPIAPFIGNLTSINVPAGDLLELQRQANCSLTMGWAGYTLTLPTISYSVAGTTANYDQVLHNEAGLTTTGGSWPAGCGDPTLGITARTAVPLGLTSNNLLNGAAVGYDSMISNDVIWTFVGNQTTGTNVPIGDLTISGTSPADVAAADFNGDGSNDLAVVNDSGTTGGSASIGILLGNADGSLQSAVLYTLPGEMGLSAVIDDFNKDGKLDIVATSSSFSSGTTTYYLSFLAGKGDGTFQAPQSVTVTPPPAFSVLSGSVPYYGLISADLLGNGKKDLVTSGGVVLMGNGDGTFTQSSNLAFPTPTATSDWGPNVVAADFNKDGKLDLATDDGQSITIYLGKGDGTFTQGNAYATISSIGYLNATDLDGDGNVDLFSGIARGGQLGGDKFEIGQAYALMGNGDGTFRGAPELPFVFTGTNLADLNGDKVLDGVGVNATTGSSNVSMTSYLGNGNGTFSTGTTLQISPVTIQGSSYSFSSLDSFGLGSTRGDGIVDLVYLPASFYGPGGVAGYFLATGNGDGSFNTPVFVQAPTFAPSGDFDDYETLSNLFVADVNGDGKADLIYSYNVAVYQTNTYEQGIAVQLSNGDGTFQAPQVIQTYSSTTAPTNLPPTLVQFGDATGNGKLDLFTESGALNSSTNLYTFSLQMYLGNGDGTFGSALTPPVADNFNAPTYGGTLGQIVIADMNGDGKPDLVTLGTASDGNSELAISLGNGDGTFRTPTKLEFAGGETDGYGLAVADFNGDGKLDVAVAGFNPPFDTGIFLGNGDGTVQTFTSANGAVEPSEAIDLLVFGTAQAVKLNGSGLPALVAGGAVLVNQASTTPTLTPTTTSLSSSGTSIIVGQTVTFTASVSASPTPAGSVTFFDGTTALATTTLNPSGVAIYSTSNLSVGSHSITAAYQGNSTFAASTSGATTVTVSAPVITATTTNLTASASSVNAGTSVTFNAKVTPASGTGTPTGTVSFMQGATTLAVIGLTNGAAGYSTSSLPVGADVISAVYSGDASFQSSTSNSVTVTVQALVPSFTVGVSPASGTVTAGVTAQTTITVNPVNGFNQQVSFACSSGVPTGGTCSFSPSTVTPGGNSNSTTLSVATTSQSAALKPLGRATSRGGLRGAATLAFLAGGALWFFRRRKGLRLPLMLPMVVGLAALGAILAGCTGSGSNSSGTSSQPQSATYSITVTATAGTGTPQTASYVLTVTK